MPSRGSPNSARRSSRTNATLHPPNQGIRNLGFGTGAPIPNPQFPVSKHRLRRDPTPGPDVRTADAQTPLWLGNQGIWLALPLSEILTTAAILVFYLGNRKPR